MAVDRASLRGLHPRAGSPSYSGLMRHRWPEGTRGSVLLLVLAMVPILLIAVGTVLAHID